MSKKLALLASVGATVGLNISSLIPEPTKPKEITQHDLDRIAKAEDKRLRRRAKRINNKDNIK